MKQKYFIICAFVIFCVKTFSMEKSPRLSPDLLYSHEEISKIHSLLNSIEAETEYPNPYAPARIKDTSEKLLSLANKNGIWEAWNQSSAFSRSKLLQSNAAKMVDAHQIDNLAESAKLLLVHAHQIFLTIHELDQQIQNLNSVLPCDS